MARKAQLIALREFEAMLREKLLDDVLEIGDKKFDRWKPPHELSRKVDKDLGKINFDWENYDLVKVDQLFNALPVAWFYAGGDWQYPVHFIIYWSGKEFRGYIPENGNVYNKKTKAAYGEEYEYGEEDVDTEHLNEEPDFKLMEQDIINRIQIV